MGAQSHILVVDDEVRQILVLQKMLSTIGDGCQVDITSSAQEALDKVGETRFDLILTDLAMPGMDGIALTRAIRALNAETTVVWITAHGCQRFSREAEQLGVYSCLDKPVRIDRIRETVREALGAKLNSLLK